MTPLRILFGLSWPVTLRRLLGLFAFFYACLHFSVWLVVDHYFDWPELAKAIDALPTVLLGRPLTVELEDTDEVHDGFGKSIWHASESYLTLTRTTYGVPFPGSPEELATFQATETMKWGEIVTVAGMKEP